MRKRPRRLWCRGQNFVWIAEIRHVPGSTDCHRCIRVRAWGAGRNSRPVEVDLLSVTWPAPWGACATDTAYPEPHDIRAIIEYACRAGWDFHGDGAAFVLSELDHPAFRLDDFLITDRLRSGGGADPTTRVIRAFEQVELRTRRGERPPSASPLAGGLPHACGG